MRWIEFAQIGVQKVVGVLFRVAKRSQLREGVLQLQPVAFRVDDVAVDAVDQIVPNRCGAVVFVNAHAWTHRLASVGDLIAGPVR